MSKQIYTYHVREYKHPSKSLHKVGLKDLEGKDTFSIKIKAVLVDYDAKHNVLVVNKSDDIDEYVMRKNKKLLTLLKNTMDFEVVGENDGLCHYLNFGRCEDGEMECRLSQKPVVDKMHMKIKSFLKRAWENDATCCICLEVMRSLELLDIFSCCGVVIHSGCGVGMEVKRCPYCKAWC